MELVNTRNPEETPDKWWHVIRASCNSRACVVISPFVCMWGFYSFSEHLCKQYKNCRFPIQPIRELSFDANKPKEVSKRASWNGLWEQIMPLNKKKIQT